MLHVGIIHSHFFMSFFMPFDFSTATNILEALAVGSTIAIKMIAYIVVNLIAFMATIAFLDAVLAYLGTRAGYPDLSFQV